MRCCPMPSKNDLITKCHEVITLQFHNLLLCYVGKAAILSIFFFLEDPPVALNQYTLVNRTHKHYIYILQGPTNILKSHQNIVGLFGVSERTLV